MQIRVSEIKYPEETIHPNNFVFEVDEEIGNDDEKLSAEIYRLVKEATGLDLIECDVDVD